MYSHLLIVCVSRLRLCKRVCRQQKGLLTTIRTPHAPFKTMIICFVLLSVNYHYSFDRLSAAEPSVWSKVFLRAFKLFEFLWGGYSLLCVYPQQYGLTTPDRTIDSIPRNKQIKNRTRKTTEMWFHSLVILSDRFSHLIISLLGPKCCTCQRF